MSRSNAFVVLLGTFLAFALLYAPQPLLPVLADRFGIPETQAATLITWSLLPMSLGPVLVGALMQVVAPRRLLAWGLGLLGLSEIAFFLASDVFSALQGIRFVQGALVAVVMPATMTYIALAAGRLREVMAAFVAASVLGGLLGRIAAGLAARAFGWEVFFLVLGLALLAIAAAAFRLAPESVPPQPTIRLSRLARVLRQGFYLRLYGVVFAAFFVFTALLNFIPFRLGQVSAGMDAGRIALSYSGFVLGMTTALLAPPIARRLGGELRAVAAGLGGLGLAMGLAWTGSVAAIVAAVAAAAAGFFLVHSVLAGYLNVHAGEHAASVSGLYVAIYYTGGTLGSYLPGFVYTRLGWPAFVAVLAAMIAAGLALTAAGMRAERRTAARPPAHTSKV